MKYSRKEIDEMGRKLEYELSVLRTRLAEYRQAVASIPIPEASGDFACSCCVGLSFPSERRLQEHRANVHHEWPGESRLASEAETKISNE